MARKKKVEVNTDEIELNTKIEDEKDKELEAKLANDNSEHLDKLSAYRLKINAIDDRIVELLNMRYEVVKEVGQYKKENGIPVYDSHREEAVINRLEQKETNQGMVRKIWYSVMDFAKTLE